MTIAVAHAHRCVVGKDPTLRARSWNAELEIVTAFQCIAAVPRNIRKANVTIELHWKGFSADQSLPLLL
jgi:hypothetical protein